MTTQETEEVLQDKQAIQFFKELNSDRIKTTHYDCHGIRCGACPLKTYSRCCVFPSGFYEKLLDLISQKPLRLNIKKL